MLEATRATPRSRTTTSRSTRDDPRYAANHLRQDLWRAGHAHAGVLLVLSLVALQYVDDANLPRHLKAFARSAIPIAAILLPAGFFLSVLTPDATQANDFIYLCFAGAIALAAGVLVLGIGLIRRSQPGKEPHPRRTDD